MTIATIDPKNLLRPARPQLREALTAVAGHTFVAAAWEAMATRGFVPSEWVGDPRRMFRQPLHFGTPETYILAGSDGGPPTFEIAALVGSDAATMAAVEVLAHDLAKRLRPWGAPAPLGVVWTFVDRATWVPGARDGSLHAVTFAAWRAWNALPEPPPLMRVSDRSDGVAFALGNIPDVRACAASQWEACADVPAFEHSLGKAWRHLRFGELPNPFPVDAAFWNAGYGFAGFDDGWLVLIAPTMEAT